jgi:hypothetical protein
VHSFRTMLCKGVEYTRFLIFSLCCPRFFSREGRKRGQLFRRLYSTITVVALVSSTRTGEENRAKERRRRTRAPLRRLFLSVDSRCVARFKLLDTALSTVKSLEIDSSTPCLVASGRRRLSNAFFPRLVCPTRAFARLFCIPNLARPSVDATSFEMHRY